jgi:hypothetical protein
MFPARGKKIKNKNSGEGQKENTGQKKKDI